MTSEPIVFDTSVLIDHFRTNCHAVRMEALAGTVLDSSVVLAELWRGAKTEPERRALTEIAQNGILVTPSEADWIESGQVLSALRRTHGFEPAKLRDLHFDVLIALSARAYGARLISSNRSDFEMIRKPVDFKLEIW